MPSDKPDRVEKWVNTFSSPITLTIAALQQKAAENGLRIFGPDSNGYKYVVEPSDEGAITYRAPDVDWSKIPPSATATANPAAGADPAAWTVPAGKKWLIIAAFNYGTTDANVANRYPYLHIKSDGSVSSQIIVGPTPITASIANQYVTFAAGAGNGGAAGAGLGLTVGIGQGIEVAAGGTIRIQYLNIQVGDDWAAAVLTYKEAPA